MDEAMVCRCGQTLFSVSEIFEWRQRLTKTPILSCDHQTASNGMSWLAK